MPPTATPNTQDAFTARPIMTHALATVALVLSLLVVLGYWYGAQERGLRQAERDFQAESSQVAELLRQRLLNYELLVRGGASLQASLPQPSRIQWQRYVNGLDIERRFPSIRALGFALDVSPQQLGALQQVLRGSSRATGKDSGMHALVLYLAPEGGRNARATGVDLAAEDGRREAMGMAAGSGDLRMSALVPAVSAQPPAAMDEMALFAPVYALEGVQGEQERRDALRGWVFAQVNFATYVATATSAIEREGHLRIVDVTEGTERVLYAEKDFGQQASDEAGRHPAFAYHLELATMGRRWRLDFESAPLAQVQREIPGLRNTLLVGLLASLLLFGIALTLARTQSKAENLAERMSDSYRRSEQRFRSAMQYSAIGKALLDREGRILEANPALAQMLGSTSAELVGTTLGQHFAEGQEETLRTVEREAIADGAYRTTRRLMRSDGDVRHASLTFAAVPGDSGDGFASLVQVEDVTERLRAEARVQALNRTLEARVALRTRELSHANQELEAFAYSVSHDLRAPLRSIDGFSRLLSERYEDVVDASGQDYLQRIRNASVRMGDLIDALLKMSRVSRSEIRHAEVDLSAMTREIAAELRSSEPDRGVAFAVQPGLKVRGDPALLRNLMDNLLGNAWKFTRGVQDARIEVGENAQGEIFVRDNGAGFAPEYAAKLFRPFQRLHSEQDYAGHGIGLASVKRIVERHGGSIRAEGAVGRGATFAFQLRPDQVEG